MLRHGRSRTCSFKSPTRRARRGKNAVALLLLSEYYVAGRVKYRLTLAILADDAVSVLIDLNIAADILDCLRYGYDQCRSLS